MITMKLIKKIMMGSCMAVLSVAMFSERSSASGNRENVLHDSGRYFLCFSLDSSDDNDLVYKLASQKENRARKYGGDFA